MFNDHPVGWNCSTAFCRITNLITLIVLHFHNQITLLANSNGKIIPQIKT